MLKKKAAEVMVQWMLSAELKGGPAISYLLLLLQEENNTVMHPVDYIANFTDKLAPAPAPGFYTNMKTRANAALGTADIPSTSLKTWACSVLNLVTQTMKIPLYYAEDIMGVARANIAYIRSISAAMLTVQQSRAMSDEMTVEIKGGADYIQTAQTLIQDTGFCAYTKMAVQLI
ncbi:hypothetical protein EJ110_NYTH28214 [Nymphaea thermarum]|nr:hypothetical protein EJ110_NYTH28214 [Nymphaea thermarum]